jgi:hypothetical protein
MQYRGVPAPADFPHGGLHRAGKEAAHVGLGGLMDDLRQPAAPVLAAPERRGWRKLL